jgi:hypothetical protein
MSEANGNQTSHYTPILTDLILAYLTPMFLAVTGGNIQDAHFAAAQALESYRARTDRDLIAASQVIAFSFAALGSLTLSVSDGLSLSMILRLRGNAQGSSRAAEQNRRALQQPQPTNDLQSPEPAPDKAPVVADDVVADKAPVVADDKAPVVADDKAPVVADDKAPIVADDNAYDAKADVIAEPAAAQPATEARTEMPQSTLHQPNTPTRPSLEQRNHALWAAAFTNVAADIVAGIPNLAPHQRQAATMRAAALNSSATDLLSGNTEAYLRPGDRVIG